MIVINIVLYNNNNNKNIIIISYLTEAADVVQNEIVNQNINITIIIMDHLFNIINYTRHNNIIVF